MKCLICIKFKIHLNSEFFVGTKDDYLLAFVLKRCLCLTDRQIECSGSGIWIWIWLTTTDLCLITFALHNEDRTLNVKKQLFWIIAILYSIKNFKRGVKLFKVKQSFSSTFYPLMGLFLNLLNTHLNFLSPNMIVPHLDWGIMKKMVNVMAVMIWIIWKSPRLQKSYMCKNYNHKPHLWLTQFISIPPPQPPVKTIAVSSISYYLNYRSWLYSGLGYLNSYMIKLVFNVARSHYAIPITTKLNSWSIPFKAPRPQNWLLFKFVLCYLNDVTSQKKVF